MVCTPYGSQDGLPPGEEYDAAKRNVICQLPAEAGLPGHIGARLKRPAYGLNDAPRKWWNRLDGSLRTYGRVLTRADRCAYVLYEAAPAAGTKKADRNEAASAAATRASSGGATPLRESMLRPENKWTRC